MAETSNIALIAAKISKDIFGMFHWEYQAQHDANFDCVLEHKSASGAVKKTHPGDVVFYYFDPYLDRRVYLHTDLKSYSKATIQQAKIRDALNSLAMTVECANLSPGWPKKFLKYEKENYEIRGLLFVANHDNKANDRFSYYLNGIAKTNLSIAKDQIIHVLGPKEISDLFSIATDMKLLIQDKLISEHYRFVYPDLTLWKRHTADDQRVGATIEMLRGPYFILKHLAVTDSTGKTVSPAGCVVYYGRAGDTSEEFIYLLDCLSRYQLVNSREQIRIRAYNASRSVELKNNFDRAKSRYCEIWGFEGARAEEVHSITIDAPAQLCPNYSPDEIGWQE